MKFEYYLYLKSILLAAKFPFQRYIFCWGNFYYSKIIKEGGGGGAPRATSEFYSVKLCK